eukprot:352965-Chlamydomonas_euryale.AAC.37
MGGFTSHEISRPSHLYICQLRIVILDGVARCNQSSQHASTVAETPNLGYADLPGMLRSSPAGGCALCEVRTPVIPTPPNAGRPALEKSVDTLNPPLDRVDIQGRRAARTHRSAMGDDLTTC